MAVSTIYKNNTKMALMNPQCGGETAIFYRAVREEGEVHKPRKYLFWRPLPPPRTATPRGLCIHHFIHKASLSTVYFFPLHVSYDKLYPLLFIFAIIFIVYTHTHTPQCELHKVTDFRFCSQINPKSWGQYLVHSRYTIHTDWAGRVPSRRISKCKMCLGRDVPGDKKKVHVAGGQQGRRIAGSKTRKCVLCGRKGFGRIS